MAISLDKHCLLVARCIFSLCPRCVVCELRHIDRIIFSLPLRLEEQGRQTQILGTCSRLLAGIHELGGNAMDQTSSGQIEESFLTYEILDEELEACVSADKANSITLWVCTALYFCPGP